MKFVGEFFGAPLAFGLVLFSTTAATAFQDERDFLPSPNGQYIASVANHDLSIPLGAEGIELSASVTVKIRDSKGKSLCSVSVAKGRKQYEIGYGHVSMIWSPDSQRLACCNQGNLSVVEVRSRKSQTLRSAVSTFRWVGSSNLYCITGELWMGRMMREKGLFSVVEISARDGSEISRLTKRDGKAFHSLVSEECNQLSPDSTKVVFMDETQMVISGLRDTNDQHVLRRELNPEFCLWVDTGSRCLVSGSEFTKIMRAGKEDTTIRVVAYLYETNDGRFTDLTDNLRQLNNDPRAAPPGPRAENRVWSPKGDWFLVSGGVIGSSGPDERDWICVPRPWSSICIQEVLGKNFHHPKVAPSGSRVGLISAPSAFTRSGDLFVVEIQSGAKGELVPGKPVKLATAVSDSWFWSADGKQLIVWNGGKFTYHPIPSLKELP